MRRSFKRRGFSYELNTSVTDSDRVRGCYAISMMRLYSLGKKKREEKEVV
tara:strand:- start:8 stop:157 length:150 start_codon:yes stop_codon:yes gene_type:complete